MNNLGMGIQKVFKKLTSHKYIVIGLVVFLLILLISPLVYNFLNTRGNRYDISRTSIVNIPFHRVGIVFGAGILPDKQPTPYLAHRIDTAIELYKAHRVDVLLMSGDNSTIAHNEPLVMEIYAIKHGVPKSAIVIDDAGFDTYDTCYRAHAIFGITSATLISQGYHLPRAMTTCKGLGVSNIGVIAIHPTRDYTISYVLREILSSDKMVFQLIFKPTPSILGKSIQI
jgi:vancomycin permeability regulator SanA